MNAPQGPKCKNGDVMSFRTISFLDFEGILWNLNHLKYHKMTSYDADFFVNVSKTPELSGKNAKPMLEL